MYPRGAKDRESGTEYVGGAFIREWQKIEMYDLLEYQCSQTALRKKNIKGLSMCLRVNTNHHHHQQQHHHYHHHYHRRHHHHHHHHHICTDLSGTMHTDEPGKHKAEPKERRRG
ncbi:hypothetical protein PV325_004513 [Microctonus aethiopoides]|nr:hypothetical protein PV325_004513 [Microctonus aethiopoides]